jgi:hypothetical protein
LYKQFSLFGLRLATLILTSVAGAAKADNPPPPQITITAPVDGLVTNATNVTVSGTAFASPGAEPVTVTIDSIPATVNPDGTFTGTVVLDGSWNPISVVATDALGQQTWANDTVTQDVTPPWMYLFNIADGAYVQWDPLVPSCGAGDDNLAWATFTLDGAPYVCGDPIYGEGQHTLAIDAMDLAGNESLLHATFVIDHTPPAVSFTGATQGGTSPGPVSVNVNVTDPWGVLWTSVLIDGSQTFDNPIVVTAPGNHAIAVSTSDQAFNGTFQELDFTVGDGTGTPSPLTSCQLSGIPGSMVAGQTAAVTFTGLDANNAVVSGFAGNVSFTAPADAGATLPSVVSFGETENWQRAVGGFSFSSAGDWTLTGTSGGISCSASVHVINDVASQLVLSGVPSSAPAGVAVPVTVQALDQYGNPAIDYLGSISFSTSAQETEPVQQTFVSTDLGTRTIDVSFSVAGAPRTLTVTDDADSSMHASATLAVAAGAFNRFLLADVGVPARTGFARNVGVTAQDAFGNVIPDYAGTAHFSSSDGAATLPADFAFSGTENGEAVLDHALTLRTTGSQTLQIADASGAGQSTLQSFTVASVPAACSGLSGSNWTGSAVLLSWCDFCLRKRSLFGIRERLRARKPGHRIRLPRDWPDFRQRVHLRGGG